MALVVALERAVFSDPWSARDFTECLAAGIPFLVAVDGPDLTGYAVARHAADEGEILNLGVAPRHRRRGIGRALVEHMLGHLAEQGVRVVYLEVRASNAAARGLYERMGFAEVGRRGRYYRRPVEDAVILRARLPAAGVTAKL